MQNAKLILLIFSTEHCSLKLFFFLLRLKGQMSSRNHRTLQGFALDSPPPLYQTSFFLRHHNQIIFHSFTPDIFAPTIGPQYVLSLYRESFFFIISFAIACSPLRFKSRHPGSFCMASKRVHIPSTHTQPLWPHRDLLHSQFTA